MESLFVLSAADIAQLELAPDAVIGAVEAGLIAQASGDAVAAPTVSYLPDPARSGLHSAIRGALPGDNLAVLKAVGTYPDNAARGLTTNPGILILFASDTGLPIALLDASWLTTLRTAAVTASGIRALARPDARVLACIGTRGIAVEAVRLVAGMLALQEVRIHGRDPQTCRASAASLSSDLGVAVRATASWHECLDGADIMIEGASLDRHRTLFPLETIVEGTTLAAFGAFSSFPDGLPARIDRLIMDRWVDGDSGALGPHVARGQISEGSVDGYIGDVLAGQIAGRRDAGERILFWHRGVAACDILLAEAMIDAARKNGLGQTVPFHA